MATKRGGFYKRLNVFSTADEWQEKDLKGKKRVKTQGVYKVEEILAVRQKKGMEREFLIKWSGWGSEYNSWEVDSHILDRSIIEAFEHPTPSPSSLEAHVELIKNAIEGGLNDALQTDVTLIFSHAVFRYLFKGKGRVCGKDAYSMTQKDFPRKYFPQGWDKAYTKRGTIREITYPLHLHIFLSRSRQMYHKDGSKKLRR